MNKLEWQRRAVVEFGKDFTDDYVWEYAGKVYDVVCDSVIDENSWNHFKENARGVMEGERDALKKELEERG